MKPDNPHPQSRYETQADRLNEYMIMAEFLTYINQGRDYCFSCGKIKQTQTETPIPDFRIIRERDNKVVGYMEVKDRSNYSWADVCRLGGPMLAKKKWDMLAETASKGYRVAFVCKFKDRLVFVDVANADTRVVKDFSSTTIFPFRKEDAVIINPENFITI